MACVGALAAATSAGAAKDRLSAADRAAINATLDVLVNHAVKRKDVGKSYDVVTPALRGGMTRAQWSRGSIPVYPYPAAGRRFHEWTVQYRTAGRDRAGADPRAERAQQEEAGSVPVPRVPTAERRPLARRFLHARRDVLARRESAGRAGGGRLHGDSRRADVQPSRCREKAALPPRLSSDYIFIPFAGLGLLARWARGLGDRRQDSLRAARRCRPPRPAAASLPLASPS